MCLSWKLSQVVYLKIFYDSFNIDEAQQFIGKNKKAIYEKKRRLGLLSTPNWTQTEIEILTNKQLS